MSGHRRAAKARGCHIHVSIANRSPRCPHHNQCVLCRRESVLRHRLAEMPGTRFRSVTSAELPTVVVRSVPGRTFVTG